MIHICIHGKFDTASRKVAGVIVSGNSVYVTESAFEQYANYKCFWVFSNDEGSGNNSELLNTAVNSSEQTVNYIRYVSTQSANLNVRSEPGTNYNIVRKLAKGTSVTVTKVDGSWSYITSPVTGWVSSAYLSSTVVTTTSSSSSSSSSTNYSTSVGSYYRLKNKTTLYASSSMSGTSYNYLAQTQIKVVSHYSSNVDYVYVVKTGRYAYCYTSAYPNTISSSSSTTASYSTNIGSYYTLKSKTTLYSKGTLTGTAYSYLSGTKVQVISHYSSNVDYIYIPKTRKIRLL